MVDYVEDVTVWRLWYIPQCGRLCGGCHSVAIMWYKPVWQTMVDTTVLFDYVVIMLLVPERATTCGPHGILGRVVMLWCTMWCVSQCCSSMW